MSREKINIAIDGYSSCGKSTLAKALAKEFGYVYVDSGAMYRCVTLYFLQNNIDLTSDDAIQKDLKEIEIDFEENKVFLNGTDVSEEIRSMQISNAVSKVSAIKAVRHAMVYLQQNIGIKQNLVMDGRDIGTTVFPKAQLKIFMTAHPMIRAQRRYKELLENGKSVPLDEVMANLNMTDYEDTHREESPLTQAEDAVVLDNSFMTPEEQLEYVREKLAGIIGG